MRSLSSHHYAMAASIAAIAFAIPASLYVIDAMRLDGSTTSGRIAEPLAPPPPPAPAPEPRAAQGTSAAPATGGDRLRKDEQGVPGAAANLAPPSPPIGPAAVTRADPAGGSQSQLGVTNRTATAPADGLAAGSDTDRRLPDAHQNERLADDGKKEAKPDAGYAIAGRLEAAKPAVAPNMPSASEPYIAEARPEERDRFEGKETNPVKQVASEPVSTFSIDVDTASYAFVRRALNAGELPPKAAVRVEEMINYFPYAYPKPATSEEPFKPTVSVLAAPWNPGHQIVHVAIKGYELTSPERPRANLVFLVDVSGSMTSSDKLPLVRRALAMLVEELKPEDTVGIVTYASGSGVALAPTKASEKRAILAAIDALQSGGSTAGADGIRDAYRLAEEHFDAKGVNRIVLATDGDFNVGVTDHDQLKGLIERKREKGIFLSILGVGRGNYNDALMQRLAQNGNGTAAYVDTLNEARKVLVEEASSTLFPIAKDVKIQIEWNPSRVSEYRLLGYETRALAREDFNNDRVDAGDIGAGHTVTAIYEVTPVGSASALVDPLRYGTPDTSRREPEAAGKFGNELGFLKLRYKLPKEDTSRLIEMPIAPAVGGEQAEAAPAETRFSVAVAAFGELLRGSPYMKSYALDDVIALAAPNRGDDPFGYRAEFLSLVRLAKSEFGVRP